jgi:fatty-acyl-CoA synthase
MDGLMMHRPLLVADILTYAADTHRQQGVTSVTVEGGLHRQTWPQTAERARKLANALLALGVVPGDRVATLAWNGYRHLELYYGVPGIGAICHTLNPRLSAEQMTYIVAHAEDKAMFLDLTFVPLIEKMHAHFPRDMIYVIMTDAAHMPENSFNALCYEYLLAAQDDDYDWPDLPEDTACGLCYTSGTTGNPKGALYSHRSQVLHGMMVALQAYHCMRPGTKILPVVPLFHANSWGLAHAAPMVGANLIMPGPALDGASVFDLMDSQEVFSAWGVPTVWLGLMGEIQKRNRIPKGFGEVVIGGSAAAPALIKKFEERGVGVLHAWGMTEMSPVGTMGLLPPHMESLSLDERVAMKAKQGRRTFGVDLKIVDDAGARLPHDGKASGELFVRGNGIVSGYFKNDEATQKGWFGTGDVATISEDGFLTITDRAKDLIKSGGEWISSIDVENMALGHEHIANCAVIAVPHPKWDERPLLVAVAAVDTPDKASIMAHLAQHLAKWQLPDDILFVDDLPMTATGKVSKLTLRQTFSEYELPG